MQQSQVKFEKNNNKKQLVIAYPHLTLKNSTYLLHRDCVVVLWSDCIDTDQTTHGLSFHSILLDPGLTKPHLLQPVRKAQRSKSK